MRSHGISLLVVLLSVVRTPAFAWRLIGDDDGARSQDAPNVSATRYIENWTPAENLPPWLQLGGQIRGRVEGPSGTSLTNGSSDSYYASRIRVDFGIKPFSWLGFFAEAQDARAAGYNAPAAPSTLSNPLDLRQAYVDLRTKGRVSVELRAGRQELSFGGERLVGAADWGMSRTFDAVDLTVTNGNGRLDLVAGSAVLVDPTRFDRHKPGEHLYGAYGSLRKLPAGINLEPYLLFKQTLNVRSENGQAGDALVVSPGARFYGRIPGRIDYIAEVVVQQGSYAADRVRAYGQSYVLGWTLADTGWKPRLSAEYSYASGDATAKDGHRGTFDQFYPSNHGYYGMIDQFGWKNLKNGRGGFDCQISRKIKLRTDFNQFFLASVEDGLYNSAGTSIVLNRSASSSHIGWATNTVLVYQWSKMWKFGAGYGHLFAGDFLKQCKMGGGYSYPYVFFTRGF